MGARNYLRLLGQAASLSLWRRPRQRPVAVGFGAFIVSVLLAAAFYAWQDYSNTDPPAHLDAEGLHAHASYWLAALCAAWLGARLLQRPSVWLSLASLLVLIGIPWTAVSVQLPVWLQRASDLQLGAWQILLAFGGLVAVVRTIGFLSPSTAPARRAACGFLCLLVLAYPWYWQQTAWLWYPPANDNTDAAADVDAVDENAPAAEDNTDPGFDPEVVMTEQAALLQSATRALSAQTPGHVDLYALGFAGDGSEAVFHNEVDYFAQLMAKRFDAGGHTLQLVNSPDTVDRLPLATLTNLRTALADIGRRMDPSEDVLLLFLTSHGSQDHQLLVDLDPLPLDQIEPQDLREALDDAGIRWRVVVVSACYSGGFVDALDDPNTLVITAARSDRTSFGCGNDSKITWFGKAFMVDALNHTRDFQQAFALASRKVREWELAEGETPSVPQIRVGRAISGKLAQWQSELPADSGAVPFGATAAPSASRATTP